MSKSIVHHWQHSCGNPLLDPSTIDLPTFISADTPQIPPTGNMNILIENTNSSDHDTVHTDKQLINIAL